MKKIVLAIAFLSVVSSLSAQGTKPTPAPPVKPPVATPASASPAPVPVKKDPPAELTTGLAQWVTLNQVIIDLKAKNGITPLETELETRRQALLTLAAKDGFHFDPPTGTFIADVLPAPTVIKTPEAAPAAADKK